MPETAKADAWDCKLDENVAGTPPAMLELASTLIGVWLAASACLTAATTKAIKAGDGTSACPLAWGSGLWASLQEGQRTLASALVEGGKSSDWPDREVASKPAARLLLVLRKNILTKKAAKDVKDNGTDESN